VHIVCPGCPAPRPVRLARRPSAAARRLCRQPAHPDEVLAKLRAGNQKFVSAPQLCTADLAQQRADLAKAQAPWPTILTCSDSRISPELVFGGVGLGEVFVAGNVGNMADTATMGTIEYAAAHLHTPLVVVMGHQRCGAVAAAPPLCRLGFRCRAARRPRSDPTPGGASPERSLPCWRTGCRVSLGHAGGLGQVFHADGAEAAFQEQARGRLDDGLA
jgi:hypothetical protein